MRRLYIYHLSNPNDHGWDCAANFVVRARSSSKARKLASESARDEGGAVWIDPRRSKCRKLGEVTPGARTREEVVVEDVNWG